MAERVFPNAPSAATQARRFVLEALGSVTPEIAEDAAVMVSELATNSLRHASTQFTVSIDRTDNHVRIAVDDSGPGEPHVQSPPPGQPTGRGLRIVDALSDGWGVEQHRGGPGKTVWFVVDLEGTPRRQRKRA